MSAKECFDTNLLVYRFDRRDQRKAAIAELLMSRAVLSDTGVISYQTVQEFINVALRKFQPPLQIGELRRIVRVTMRDFKIVLPSTDLFQQALTLWDTHQLSWHDALIVAAAIQAGCDKLYTEDGPTGQRIGGVRLVNPFVTAP